jgi:uncharacterized protein YkwD
MRVEALSLPWVVSALLLLGGACGGESAGDTAGDAATTAADGGSEGRDEIPGIVAAHNAVRDTVGVPHLSWDGQLGNVAQAWADGCVFEHSSGSPYGENLFASTPAGNATAQGVVDSWASEVDFYDYDTNSCAANEQCGHYTQIVWDSTERVGCGFAVCPEASSPFGGGFGDWELWVCNYDPPGNWVGEKPY